MAYPLASRYRSYPRRHTLIDFRQQLGGGFRPAPGQERLQSAALPL